MASGPGAAGEAALAELRSLPAGRAVFMTAGAAGSTGSSLMLRCEVREAVAAIEKRSKDASAPEEKKDEEQTGKRT